MHHQHADAGASERASEDVGREVGAAANPLHGDEGRQDEAAGERGPRAERVGDRAKARYVAVAETVAVIAVWPE